LAAIPGLYNLPRDGLFGGYYLGDFVGRFEILRSEIVISLVYNTT